MITDYVSVAQMDEDYPEDPQLFLYSTSYCFKDWKAD